MKAGPSSGIGYNVKRNADSENPNAEYSPGSDGTGEMNGLNTNHTAVGIASDRANVDGRGRGLSAIRQVSVQGAV